MKRRVLSLFIALCMVVSLLPVTAFAAAETATFIHYDTAMNPLVKTVNNDGVAKYFYVVDGLVVDTKAGVAASEDDYNIKFVYPADGNPTIYLDGAAIVSTREGLIIGAASKGDAEDFTLVVESDSSIATIAEYNPGLTINTTGDVTITSVGKAELTVKASKQNNAVNGTAGGDLYFTDAYVNILQESDSVHYHGILLAGNVFIEGGAVEIVSAGPNIWLSERGLVVGSMQNTSGTPRNITVKNGTLIATCEGTYREAVGFDGTFTVDNANVSVSRAVGGKCLAKAPTIIGEHTVTGRPSADDRIPYVIEHKHVVGAAGGDCTASVCVCGYTIVATGAAHIPAADDGDCTTDILCANPGCTQAVTAGYASHAFGTDGVCTHPGCTVECKHIYHIYENCLTGGVCAECGAELAPVGHHTEKIIPGKEATCTETGLTVGLGCAICDEIFIAQEVIPAGHIENIIPGKAATCTEAGYCDVVWCAVCEKVLTGFTEIPALGHTDGDCVPVDEESHSVLCDTCGEVIRTEAHTYDDESDATCNVCGYERKLACETHVPGTAVKENVVASTTTTAGSYELVEYCEVCGEELYRETVTTHRLNANLQQYGTLQFGLDAGIRGGLMIRTKNLNYTRFFVEMIRFAEDADGNRTIIKQELSDPIVNGNYQTFSWDVAAKEMAEVLVLTVCAEDANGIKYGGEPIILSMKDVAFEKLDSYSASGDMAKTKMLANLLDYAAKAQDLFNYNTKNLATDGMLSQYASLIMTEEYEKEAANLPTTGLRLSSLQFALESKIELGIQIRGTSSTYDWSQHTIVVKHEDVNDQTGTTEIKTYTYTSTDESVFVAGRYLTIKFTELKCNDLAENVTVTICDLNGNMVAGTVEVTSSGASLAKQKIDAHPVYAAMLNYGACAKEAFG